MQRHKKLKPTHKRNLILLALALVVATTLLALKTIFRPEPLQIAQIGSESGTVTLKLEADTITLEPSQTTTVKLTYASGSSHLTAVQSELSYDPTLIELSSPVVHSAFPTSIIAPTIGSGKLSFALGVALSAGAGTTGNGELLTFTLKALKAGDASITFSDNTLATTRESTTNSLNSVVPLTLTLGTASPSPSAIASPSLSPSPSPSPSTPVGVKPSSPNNLRYNCYSGGTRITLRWDDVAGADSYEAILDQKDGDADQTKAISRAEIDLDLKPNTPYIWKVAALENNLKSDYASINDVKCNGDSTQATPTPSPSATPTPTPSPSKQPITQRIVNVFKKSPSPQPSTTPQPSPSFIPYKSPTPTPTPGSLSDIYRSTPPTPTPITEPTPTSLWSKIFLGWRALFEHLLATLGQ